MHRKTASDLGSYCFQMALSLSYEKIKGIELVLKGAFSEFEYGNLSRKKGALNRDNSGEVKCQI